MMYKIIHIALDILIVVALLLNLYLGIFTYILDKKYTPPEIPEDPINSSEVVPETEENINPLPSPTPDTVLDYVPAVEDVEAIAKTMYGECRGIPSDMEKAAVAWCILNRLDNGNFGDSVLEVVSAPHQFSGYKSSHPLREDLVALAEDVLVRWYQEKNGVEDVGRVLPSDYLFFVGDSEHNWFAKEYRSRDYWDWSLEDVYS